MLIHHKLADLSQYFTEDELSKYVDSYIQEGYFNQDGALYLFPVAKSTEITMLNKTDWEPFAEAAGTTVDELATTEGIVQVAQRYYEWTDAQTPDVPAAGKAFYGRDSMSNYFLISMKQMGKELFEVKDGKVTLNTDKELVRRIWDNYYVPFMKGYFASLGKFRSDDVKTGDVIAYTGSTSSAVYFPDSVETEDSSYPIFPENLFLYSWKFCKWIILCLTKQKLIKQFWKKLLQAVRVKKRHWRSISPMRISRAGMRNSAIV